MRNTAPKDASEIEALETREWLESLDYVLKSGGPVRVSQLLRELSDHARRSGVKTPFTANTPYINTIPADEQPPFPGSREIERRIKSLVRWNALAMVVKANKAEDGIGGHISTYASAATLYEVGFNHFFKGKGDDNDGDIIYFQGHAAPGIYARAFLEGRLSAEQLENFRRELKPGGGLSSYPHPWLMPDFWEFPTVSMGLGPICAIYQARFMHYLEDRGLKKHSNSKVWAFLGDGETDEPESLGAITLASREKLDNLIFVINCNLQRLDGPVRGNGQIIQELEAIFRGAGWNVLKVIWGSEWDALLAKDTDGLLVKRMGEVVDGEYQKYAVESGAYVRQHFWGADPRLLEMVAHLSDEQLKKLTLGGHDPVKVYAAYKAAVEHTGPADRHPGAHHQGLRHRRGGRGQEHHPPAEEAERGRAEGVPHPVRHPDRRRGSQQGAVLPALGQQPRGHLSHRTAQTARRLRALPQRPGRTAQDRFPPRALQGIPRRQRRPQGLDDDGVRPHAGQAAARQGDRRAGGADRARRGAHVRHGGALPPGRHLLARRPALRAGRHGHAALLQGSQGRADPRGRDQRGGLDLLVHRRRQRLRDARRQHHPVLHLLLDVRHAARRRPGVGRGRHAHARVPARRHGGAHDALRRRAAAPGRPQPPAVAGGAEPDLVRPDVRLRNRGDPRRRHPPDVQGRRERLLLPHRDERDLRDAGDARGLARGHPEGALPAAAVVRRRRPRAGRS